MMTEPLGVPASILEHVIEREGGWRLVEVENDRGGATYAGISMRANPDWPGWEVLRVNGPDPKAPGSPLFELVVALYNAGYWHPLRLDEFVSWAVARIVFSLSVLTGPRQAAELLQRAIGVEPDGVIGPVTLAAVNASADPADSWRDPGGVAARVALEAIDFHLDNARRRPSQRGFLDGWIRRTLIDAGVREG